MIPISTGLNGLDNILNNLQKGDNIVWQVDNIKDYQSFVTPYVNTALQNNQKVVYIRFAKHQKLIDTKKVKTYQLRPSEGFEAFASQVHYIIAKEGKDVYYVFDCLSDLLIEWSTDLMIGNFFMITCPYLFELDTITYFALLRNNHSYKTIARIRETTQLLIDLYNIDGKYYIHPLKVWKRYSPTMFLPHLKDGDMFVPLTNSVDAARLFSHISESGQTSSKRFLDYWDRLFIKAEELLSGNDSPYELKQSLSDKLCSIMIAREERILSLAKKYFTIEDLIAVKKRLIGTGFIGGKSVGMLLANNIIKNDTSQNWQQMLEPHDSFYVGSDVFYTYIVENGWWKMRMQQKTKEGYFKIASELREKMLTGKFPYELREQLMQMIEYYGQSPIIVRSSSLLEDAYGNAFAGKYESIFLVNQGSPEQRYSQLEAAIKQIFASTLNEDALRYRLQRGLDQLDEQMALLIQRVSGSYHQQYFFPDLGGVGVSYNTFVWNPQLSAEAGLVRLVFGLGTRAVNRVEDDYPRVIALDNPMLRPLADINDVRKFSQHQVDVLDIKNNELTTVPFQKLISEIPGLNLDLLADIDNEITQKSRERGIDKNYLILTFDKLLSQTNFTNTIQNILKVLETNYDYPIDIEFTINFAKDGSYMINLLQCRPLQTRGQQPNVTVPENIPAENIIFKCHGYFMGGNILQDIKRIVYVDPAEYEKLPINQRYDIARIVGALNQQISSKENMPYMLLGPGRWGTSTPSLGVPVNFSEISNAVVLAEMAFEGANLMPELSFGTHFFQDLVETGIFYVAIFPKYENFYFNKSWFENMPNHFAQMLPLKEKYSSVIKVCDFNDGKNIKVAADIISQKLICFIE